MKIMTLWIAAAMGMGSTATADDPKKDAPAPEKVIAMEEGTWDAVVMFYPPGSGEKGMQSKAVETNMMLGTWLVSDFKGEYAGQPFSGHAQYGFDPKKGKYVGTWVDSMSTTMSMMEGTYDPATKTLTFLSETDDPHTGKPMKTKFLTVLKEGSRVSTEYAKPEGATDFVKVMEITYKKKAK